MDKTRIIVVEDNIVYCEFVCNLLAREGFRTVQAYHLSTAKKLLQQASDGDIVVSDLRLPDGDGIGLLRWMRKEGMTQPLIIMTNYAEVHTAVESMKLGSLDYIPKQLVEDKLMPLLHTILKERSIGRNRMPVFARDSSAFQKIMQQIRLVAPTDMSVLIFGENGTGKEHIAHHLHDKSKRAGKPFVPVGCGSLSKDLAPSAFFGHVKGAFTGADSTKKGYFNEAEGGTLFLDEVGNLALETQQMLLRAIQERRYRPIGDKTDKSFNVRIIAATNANLEQAVADGRFREDLYYRLKVVTLWTPPLRERREDIPALAAFLLHRQAAELHRPDPGLEEEALRYLAGLDWPGNVRELSNACKRPWSSTAAPGVSIRDLQLVLDSPAAHPPAAGLSTNGNGDTGPAPGVRRSPVGTGNGFHEGEAPVEDAPAPAGVPHSDEQRSLASIVTACLRSGDPSPFDTCMDIMGRAVVREALRQCRGNRSQAARLLGLSRPTLLARMEKYGLKIETRISDE